MVGVICLRLFAVAIFIIISQRGHFFMVLLSFEVITLAVFLCFICFLSRLLNGSSGLLALIFLVMAVCEARMGLGLLVSSMRGQGFDFVKTSLRLKF